MLGVKMNCKLEQCEHCKKTFSKNDGNIEEKVCNSCIKKHDHKKEVLLGLAKAKDLKRKRKPARTEKDMEKLADFYN